LLVIFKYTSVSAPPPIFKMRTVEFKEGYARVPRKTKDLDYSIDYKCFTETFQEALSFVNY